PTAVPGQVGAAGDRKDKGPTSARGLAFAAIMAPATPAASLVADAALVVPLPSASCPVSPGFASQRNPPPVRSFLDRVGEIRLEAVRPGTGGACTTGVGPPGSAPRQRLTRGSPGSYRFAAPGRRGQCCRSAAAGLPTTPRCPNRSAPEARSGRWS